MNFQTHFCLKNHNTFHIEVTTDFFCELTNQADIPAIHTFITKNKLPYIVLGEGSNILFSTHFKGVIIKNNIQGIELTEQKNNNVLIRVGAGEIFDHFVSFTVKNNLYGIENLSGIPGSVGAAPVQNIGAYGKEIQDCIESVTFYDWHTQTLKTRKASDCNFAYRESIFKYQLANSIITHVTFRLSTRRQFHLSYKELQHLYQDKNLTLAKIRNTILHIRNGKLPDPKRYGNAGSFFKNPIADKSFLFSLQKTYPHIPFYPLNADSVKLSAAWLIEQCGWKGYRKEGAGVFEKHALILINYDTKEGKKIYDLAQAIIQSVEKKFAIRLIPEVNIY